MTVKFSDAKIKSEAEKVLRAGSKYIKCDRKQGYIYIDFECSNGHLRKGIYLSNLKKMIARDPDGGCDQCGDIKRRAYLRNRITEQDVIRQLKKSIPESKFVRTYFLSGENGHRCVDYYCFRGHLCKGVSYVNIRPNRGPQCRECYLIDIGSYLRRNKKEIIKEAEALLPDSAEYIDHYVDVNTGSGNRQIHILYRVHKNSDHICDQTLGNIRAERMCIKCRKLYLSDLPHYLYYFTKLLSSGERIFIVGVTYKRKILGHRGRYCIDEDIENTLLLFKRKFPNKPSALKYETLITRLGKPFRRNNLKLLGGKGGHIVREIFNKDILKLYKNKRLWRDIKKEICSQI